MPKSSISQVFSSNHAMLRLQNRRKKMHELYKTGSKMLSFWPKALIYFFMENRSICPL